MPRKPEKLGEVRKRMIDKFAAAYDYGPYKAKITTSLIKRSMKIEKTDKPLVWKAREFARTAFLIDRALERGIISESMAKKLLGALQSRASETVQREASKQAGKGIIDQKLLNALERLVETRAIKAEQATRIASDYLKNALSNLRIGSLKKTGKWKLNVLKGIKEIIKIEAELRGFSKEIREGLLEELGKRAYETLEAEAKRVRKRVDFGTLEIIESAVKEGFIGKEQAMELKALFIKSNLEAIRDKKTLSIGIGRLEVAILSLPTEKWAKLLKLLKEARRSVIGPKR